MHAHYDNFPASKMETKYWEVVKETSGNNNNLLLLACLSLYKYIHNECSITGGAWELQGTGQDQSRCGLKVPEHKQDCIYEQI